MRVFHWLLVLCFAGAYVTAMLYRPMDERLKRMPSRAPVIRRTA